MVCRGRSTFITFNVHVVCIRRDTPMITVLDTLMRVSHNDNTGNYLIWKQNRLFYQTVAIYAQKLYIVATAHVVSHTFRVHQID